MKNPALHRSQRATERFGDLVVTQLLTESQYQCLPLAVWQGLRRADQERQLLDLSGVVADAAAVASPARAVELLEQGRSVLWSQLVERRTDLTVLRQARPDLADRLAAARDGLDRG